MAKSIDLPITGLETDKSWERYKGSRVREYLQKKIGAYYRPDRRQDDGAYHLLGFETEETKEAWVEKWQAAVDTGDADSMASLWTDGLVIQDTSLGGNTQEQRAVELISGTDTQNALVSTDGKISVRLRFTSIVYNPVLQTTRDSDEAGTLIIQRRTTVNDAWAEVTRMNMPSTHIDQTDSYTEIDLSGILPNGDYYIQFIVIGQSTGMSTSAVGFHVIKTTLAIEFASQWWVPNTTDTVSLAFHIKGSVAKSLHYEVSDSKGAVEIKDTTIPIGTEEYTENTRSVSISGLSHGKHNVRAWLSVDGTATVSDEVNAQIMVVTDSTSKDILVVLNNVAKTITNYVQSAIFEFSVYNPNAETTNISFSITNYANTETYAESPSQAYANGERNTYENALAIESQERTIHAYIRMYDGGGNEIINAVGIDVDNTQNFAPTAGADFVLNPKVRTNVRDSNNDPATIINSVTNQRVNATFSNFGFATDGWVADSNNVRCLRVPGGSEVDIDYEPLSGFANTGTHTASCTMEFDIATRNVVDENAALLKVCTYLNDNTDRPIGFELKALEACFMTSALSTKRDQDIMFQDDTRTHIAVNILYNLGSTGINYIRIFVNGIINREMEYSATDSFLQYVTNSDGSRILSSNGIRIGAEGADIDIYGIRIYKTALSAAQIRQDYIASLDKTEDKLAFREANDILGDGGTIDYTKTYDKYNTILWTGTLPYFANSIETIGDVKIHIIGDPAHSGEMKGVQTKGQGTSSKSYWKWNQQFKTSYEDGNGNEIETDFIDENGESHGAQYQLQDGTPWATKLVWKLNWASSQQSHKLGSVNLFTDLWRRVVGGNSITKYQDADGNYP